MERKQGDSIELNLPSSYNFIVHMHRNISREIFFNSTYSFICLLFLFLRLSFKCKFLADHFINLSRCFNYVTSTLLARQFISNV